MKRLTLFLVTAILAASAAPAAAYPVTKIVHVVTCRWMLRITHHGPNYTIWLMNPCYDVPFRGKWDTVPLGSITVR